MKTVIFLLLGILFSASTYASGRKPAEINMLARFVVNLESVRVEGLIGDIQSWQDIDSLPLEKQGALLGSYAPDRKNISDFFVILPSNKTLSVGKQSLRIVSAKPFNLTQWYRNQSAQNASTEEERKARLTEYDSLNPADEIIRWYAAKGADGAFIYASIPEVEFSKLCLEQNFKVPELTPYRINLAKHGLTLDPEVIIDKKAKSLGSSNSDKIDVADKTDEKTGRTDESKNEKNAHLLGWLVGLIVLASGALLIARRKKSKP